MTDGISDWLHLKDEIARLKKQIRNLQAENCRLRVATGCRVRKQVKLKVISALAANKGTSAEIAELCRCSVRYVNQLKREMKQ